MKKELQKILSQYDLGIFRSCRRLRGGFINATWLVFTTKGKYVVRIAPKKRSEKEMRFDQAFLIALRKKQFPYQIPSPLPTKKGKLFLHHHGFYLTIHAFIKGKPGSLARLDIATALTFANLYATIHSLSEHMHIPDLKRWPKRNSSNWINKEIRKTLVYAKNKKKKTRHDSLFINSAPFLFAALKDLSFPSYDELRTFPIHGDIYPFNVLMRDMRISALLDFDGSYYDTAIADITVFLVLCTRKDGSADTKLFTAFLNEYSRLHGFSKKELSLLPDSLVKKSVVDFWFDYDTFARRPEHHLPAHWIAADFARLKYFHEHKDVIKNLCLACAK